MSDDEVMELTPIAVEFTHAVVERDADHVERVLGSVNNHALAVVLAELLGDARKFVAQAQRVEKQNWRVERDNARLRAELTHVKSQRDELKEIVFNRSQRAA